MNYYFKYISSTKSHTESQKKYNYYWNLDNGSLIVNRNYMIGSLYTERNEEVCTVWVYLREGQSLELKGLKPWDSELFLIILPSMIDAIEGEGILIGSIWRNLPLAEYGIHPNGQEILKAYFNGKHFVKFN